MIAMELNLRKETLIGCIRTIFHPLTHLSKSFT